MATGEGLAWAMFPVGNFLWVTVIYEMVGLNVRGSDEKRRIEGPRTDLKLQYA